MKFKNLLTLLLITITSIWWLNSCRQAKYVPQGEYLYRVKKSSLPWNHEKKTIHYIEYDKDSNLVYSSSVDNVSTDELYEIIKPQPNMGFRLVCL